MRYVCFQRAYTRPDAGADVDGKLAVDVGKQFFYVLLERGALAARIRQEREEHHNPVAHEGADDALRLFRQDAAQR